MTTDHLEAIHVDDVSVPDAVDAAVFADPAFKAARRRFGQAIEQMVANAPTPDARQVPLNAEDAAHAAIAAAIDVAWRLGRNARPGPTS
jgi:hypothetical protein